MWVRLSQNPNYDYADFDYFFFVVGIQGDFSMVTIHNLEGIKDARGPKKHCFSTPPTKAVKNGL